MKINLPLDLNANQMTVWNDKTIKEIQSIIYGHLNSAAQHVREKQVRQLLSDDNCKVISAEEYEQLQELKGKKGFISRLLGK
jgi:hypothetical protein